MTTASEAEGSSETLTDIYDRLHPVRIRRRWSAALGLLVTAVVVLVGCAAPAPVPVPSMDPVPVRVCGTVDDAPVRVPDEQCVAGGPAVRWYEADPACLELDDRTDVGQRLNDDYLGEACDSERKPVLRAPLPTTVALRTSAPPTSRKAAPRATRAAPRTTR